MDEILCVNPDKEIIIALKFCPFAFITVCGGNNTTLLQIRICPFIFLASNL